MQDTFGRPVVFTSKSEIFGEVVSSSASRRRYDFSEYLFSKAKFNWATEGILLILPILPILLFYFFDRNPPRSGDQGPEILAEFPSFQ
ncbi:MAG: hypothetical protein WCF65_03145 [Parachlamydiaceae bacterium]